MREIYGRLNRDNRSIWLEEAIVESSDFNGTLWIEFASEFSIIAHSIVSLHLKCSLHFLPISLTAKKTSISEKPEKPEISGIISFTAQEWTEFSLNMLKLVWLR